MRRTPQRKMVSAETVTSLISQRGKLGVGRAVSACREAHAWIKVIPDLLHGGACVSQ
jgi:hypothetical protein